VLTNDLDLIRFYDIHTLMGTSPADRHAELQQLSYLLKDSLHWQYIFNKESN